MKVLKKNLADEVTWQYEGVVLNRAENYVTLEALFNRDDMPFMDIVLKRNDRFVETFYSDCWYNIFEIYDRDDGKFKGWYCNIGKPAIIVAHTVKGKGVSFVENKVEWHGIAPNDAQLAKALEQLPETLGDY